jgi:hypothetical protein
MVTVWIMQWKNNNEGTAACFHYPAIHVRGKAVGMVNSKQDELRFNICKKQSSSSYADWSKYLPAELRVWFGKLFLAIQRKITNFLVVDFCFAYLDIWLNVLYYLSFLNLILFEIYRKIRKCEGTNSGYDRVIFNSLYI